MHLFLSVPVEGFSLLLRDVCSLFALLSYLDPNLTAVLLKSCMVSYWTDTTRPRSKISHLFQRLIPRPVMPVIREGYLCVKDEDAYFAEEIKDVRGESFKSSRRRKILFLNRIPPYQIAPE